MQQRQTTAKVDKSDADGLLRVWWWTGAYGLAYSVALPFIGTAQSRKGFCLVGLEEA